MSESVHAANSIADVLRNAILEQRLAPGLQLKEQVLADAFGVPRAVIRQALASLAAARLVDHRPNQGMFVAAPSADEARDVLAARELVEAAVVKQLAKRITPLQVQELRVLVAQENKAYEQGHTRHALRLSIDFHCTLARMAGNIVYQQFLEELVARTPLVILAHQPDGMSPCTLCNHADIVDALEAHDAMEARKLMILHLKQIGQVLALYHPRKPESKLDVRSLVEDLTHA